MEESVALTDVGLPAPILEETASPAIQRLYVDIRSTLRTPLVSPLFLVLANYPDYLQLAWRQLHPNLQTVYVEQRADAIRTRAVERMTSFGDFEIAVDDGPIKGLLRLLHYVNPKLLVVVTALRAATSGQYPRLEELPASLKRQIAPGIPAAVPEIRVADSGALSEEAQRLLEQLAGVAGQSRVTEGYLAIACDPGRPTSGSGVLQSIVERPEYRGVERELRAMAEETILNFPFRVEVNPHILRLCGLSEEEADEVRSTLELFYRVLPRLVCAVALLSANALGRDAALGSPYPASTL